MTSARITAAGLGFGLAHLGLAGLITFGIFGVLPSRWWLVDAPAALLTALLLAGAVGVLRRDRLGLKLARASAALKKAATCLTASRSSALNPARWRRAMTKIAFSSISRCAPSSTRSSSMTLRDRPWSALTSAAMACSTMRSACPPIVARRFDRNFSSSS